MAAVSTHDNTLSTYMITHKMLIDNIHMYMHSCMCLHPHVRTYPALAEQHSTGSTEPPEVLSDTTSSKSVSTWLMVSGNEEFESYMGGCASIV